MNAKDVRSVLNDEVKLLAPIIDATRNHTGTITVLGKSIHSSWGDYLRQRQKNNEKLIVASDSELEDELNSEKVQINNYLGSIQETGYLAESWKVFLECELTFLQDLLNESK